MTTMTTNPSTTGGATVAAVMTRCPISVPAEASFASITAILASGRISAVPVLDHRGVPIGVVSDADLLRVPAGGEGLVARDLMTRPVRKVDVGASVESVARLLVDVDVRRVFVTEHGRLVGVLSRRDLLQNLLTDDDTLRAAVEALLRRWHDQVSVSVTDGVVLLLGRVEWRSERVAVEERVRVVPGVAAVRNRLDYLFDDRRARRDA